MTQSDRSFERSFIERNYPDILDMACAMIIGGLSIVENEAVPASANMTFSRNPDGSFQFTYQVTAHKLAN